MATPATDTDFVLDRLDRIIVILEAVLRLQVALVLGGSGGLEKQDAIRSAIEVLAE